MRTSSMWNFKSMAGALLMGFVLAAMIGSVDVAPAYGQDNHRRIVKHDNRDHRRYYHRHHRRVYRPYDHRERYYVPPRVIYAPPPPPGIRIFFPPISIHP
ncbi:MAG: hypothetical protein EHM45_09270 [Desulfobacteraceae bacterium]|nr:MAG: hypothetical protein EHM45_09270 [Desulfobacteraceae bacterium]